MKSALVFDVESAMHARVDTHMHTTFSDGRDTVDSMLAAAAARGLTHVALTDHVRRSSDWFPRYVEEVRHAALAHPELTVYVGFEAKVLDFEGTLDATEEMIAQADFVLGSVHRYPDGKGGMRDFEDLAAEEAQQLELGAALGLIGNPRVSAIGHPGGTYSRRFGPFPEELRRQLLEAARRHGKPLEVSAKYEPAVARALALHREHGTALTLGSDAHAAVEVGRIVAEVARARTSC
jgi:putative hydrolase